MRALETRMTLPEFLIEGLAFARFWAQHIVRMMYWVWIPGFVVAGVLTLRYQFRAMNALRACREGGWRGVGTGLAAALVGTACRRHAVDQTLDLLRSGVSPHAALAYWVGSHSIVLYLLVLMTLTLGIEFAFGLLLAGAVTAFIVGILGGTLVGRLPASSLPENDRHQVPGAATWRSLLRPAGWWAVLKYIGREAGGFALPLAWGILLAGFLLAAGLVAWWPALDENGGMTSHVVTAAVGPVASAGVGLTAVGALPVAASLWKTYTVAFSGLLAFVLGSLLHPLSWRRWQRAVGRGPALRLWGVTLGAAALSGLAVTGLYALVGFQPGREPLFRELVDQIIMWLPFTMGRMGPMGP